jgi:cell division cycle 14
MLSSLDHNLVIDIIPNRFIFSIARALPRTSRSVFCFTIENDPRFRYQSFASDFGPFSLLQIHTFLLLCLDHLHKHQELVHFTCRDTVFLASNSVMLAVAFRLLHLELSADDALQPFSRLIPRIKPFRDSGRFRSSFGLEIPACIHALDRARTLGWYDSSTFNRQQWEYLESLGYGGMTWIIPDKLLGFASPYHTSCVQGFHVCTPQAIIPLFQKFQIATIVRLNNKTYDEDIFKKAGFQHIDLYFPDATCPSDLILSEFLKVLSGSAIVALHCKAGLGRTYFCIC